MIVPITLLVGLVIAIAIFFFMNSKKTKPVREQAREQAPVQEAQKGIIYGSMNCKYTVKQREKYPDYDYVDCAGGGCPGFVSAFPTTKHSDGSMTVGYN
jgi:hypothetical protein